MEALTEEIIYKKTPQELTALLYEGIIENLEQSIELINTKKFTEANEKLQKANDILNRLGVGLKYEAGPIAQQLDVLYNFMADELITANLKKDTTKIQNVLSIMLDINQAWNEAMKKGSNKINPNLAKRSSAYENSIMRTKY